MKIDLAEVAKDAGTKRDVIELRPIEPRVGIEASYRRALFRLLFEAAAFVRDDLLPDVRAEANSLTRDAAGDRIGALLGLFRELLARLGATAEDMVRRV